MFQQYLARLCISACVAIMTACGGGGGGAKNTTPANSVLPAVTTPTPVESPTPADPEPVPPVDSPTLPAPSKVLLTGKVTYDRVPFEGRNYRGLDYGKTIVMPVRGVTVQLLDSGNIVRHSSQTDASGNFAFSVDINQNLRVRVLAELRGTRTAAWDVQVRDNTKGNAQYVLDGAVASVGQADTQTRNLHAPSGWDGNGYSATRSAAPFAILDSIYDAVQTVVTADPQVVLPPLSVYWSEKNIAISGNLGEGHIGTSFYTSAGPSIYLLGAADNDSDEYDRAVVQHEFGHYLENQLGRTESIGGNHSQQSRLDMRVAFGEAWGNAFAGMVSGDPVYRDSLGAGQAYGFAINVENRGYGNQGWFSEASIQALLYDLFDSNQDNSDTLSLGFKPIYDVLTSANYIDFAGFASIFAFRAELINQHPDLATDVASMLNSFDIFGNGWYGESETNNAGSAVVLPVYRQISPGQTMNVCSDSAFQDYNGVDVRRYLRITLPTTRSYSITANRNGGTLTRTNPQVRIFRQGNLVGSVLNGTPNSENAQRHLSAGDYVFEIYEESNVDGDSNNGGLACFDVRIQ